MRTNFLQKSRWKWGWQTSFKILCVFFFKKALIEVKTSGQQLSFNIFWQSLTWTNNKSKLYKISDCWSKDMLNFHFWKKGLELVSPSHFVYHLSSHNIYYQLTELYCLIVFTSWDIGQYVYFNHQFPSRGRHFEINLRFFIKPFYYMTKTEKAFKMK